MTRFLFLLGLMLFCVAVAFAAHVVADLQPSQRPEIIQQAP